MKDTHFIGSACHEINGTLPPKGPRFQYFQDCSPKQVKHAVKTFVCDPAVDDDDLYVKLMDTSGILRTGKKGFVISTHKFYSDRFIGRPVSFDSLDSVEREGETLTFIMSDGSRRSENCGEYARYIECVFRYGLAWDLLDYATYKLKDETAMKRYMQLREWILEYAEMNCSWTEFMENKSNEIRTVFESVKAEAEKGVYTQTCRLCNEFDDLFADDEERYHWNRMALTQWIDDASMEPDFKILDRLVNCARRAGDYTQEFIYGNMLMQYFGIKGYKRFHEEDINRSYGLLCEAADRADEDGEFAAEVKNTYLVRVFGFRRWPNIEISNCNERDYPRDAFCRSYETRDPELVHRFRELESAPFMDETLAFYHEKAEEGNAYAMFMLSENSIEEEDIIKYLKKAAEMDYPPALYEYGRRMASEDSEACDLLDKDTGHMLMERAAARCWGEAAYNLIEPVQNGEITGLTLEKLMEYARDGAIRSDYNAAAARAVIAQIQDEEYYFGYFEEAAKMGHVESAELLAQAYGEEEEYEEEFKWNEIAVRNCSRQKALIDSEVAASVIAALANGRGTAKDEYQAFRKVIEFLSYEYNYHNGEMLEHFEQWNPEIRDLLNHMAQLTRDGDSVAADLWAEFEEVCSGPAVESPRTLEDYLA